jgi:hypothetical protein
MLANVPSYPPVNPFMMTTGSHYTKPYALFSVEVVRQFSQYNDPHVGDTRQNKRGDTLPSPPIKFYPLYWLL